MSFNSSGQLFAWGGFTNPSQGTVGDDLYTIDLVTGVASLVADSGLDTDRAGLAFGPNDVLYLKSGDTIRTINPNTGLPTSASSPISGVTNLSSVTVIYDQIAFDTITFTDGASHFVSVDLATNTATLVGEIGPFEITALAHLAHQIPEPGTITIFVLALAGIAYTHRKRSTLMVS